MAAGGAGETVDELLERAKALNSERVVLVAPGGMDEEGRGRLRPRRGRGGGRGHCRENRPRPAPGRARCSADCMGWRQRYGDNDLDLLIRGGVTPVERTGGVTVGVVRGVTTRTTTGGSGGHHLAGADHHPAWWTT